MSSSANLTVLLTRQIDLGNALMKMLIGLIITCNEIVKH